MRWAAGPGIPIDIPGYFGYRIRYESDHTQSLVNLNGPFVGPLPRLAACWNRPCPPP